MQAAGGPLEQPVGGEDSYPLDPVGRFLLYGWGPLLQMFKPAQGTHMVCLWVGPNAHALIRPVREADFGSGDVRQRLSKWLLKASQPLSVDRDIRPPYHCSSENACSSG